MPSQAPSHEALSVLTGTNSEYIAHLYSQYLINPESVATSWRTVFDSLADDEAALLRELNGASWTPKEYRKDLHSFAKVSSSAPSVPVNQNASQGAVSESSIRDSIQALMLVRAFRARGHLIANLDPLGLKEKPYHPELDPSNYGFSSDDYDRSIFMNGVLGIERATLREIMEILHRTYCGTIGVEFLHMMDPAEKSWIQERFESARNKMHFSADEKRHILQRLTATEGFERFLNTKYTGTKRFGLDGGEAVVPAIEEVIRRAAELNLKEVVLGMAHRGRLNILTNVFMKPFTAVFSEFQGNSFKPDDVQGSGDVKYHLGTSADREFGTHTVHMSLTANPSHLEAVNPVVIGKVRAKQIQRGDKDGSEVMPILLHGDAAFAGQGLVAETLMMSELPGYRIGGTMHIVINNQIGFTTMPKFSRSGPYSTDVAKMIAAPIFHVNGDDPEAVNYVARIAAEFRQEFKKDVVIDIFCYRRNGHNEGDEPAFTQPLMYKVIKSLETTRAQYASRLIGEGVVTAEENQKIIDEFNQYLEKAFEATKSFKPNKADFLEGAWSGLKQAHGDDRRGETAIDKALFDKLGKVLTTVPVGFNLNPKIARQFEAKKKMFAGEEGFDWGTGEALAYGTLLEQGYSVRLSGQDVGRGTFSQRHAILYDQVTEQRYISLQNISDKQARFEAHDSPLSEAAVLGFEYGYSLADPRTLTLWEAQFGDFVNGAQVLIDQFISSGESKWLRMSGLVMLLPHGYEGQGPEHSSGRVERFLQACADDNWQVANCTTPANYFHILRRQMCRDFRKPLVIMTPKSLLRHKLAVSKMDDFLGQSTFHRILMDDDQALLAKPKDMKRIVLCTGKVYYDLLEERRKRNIKDVMIVRVEQLYPFPHKSLVEVLKQYPNADVVWCQEEPRNMGYWSFVNELVEAVMIDAGGKHKRPRYAGRVASASPATGLTSVHNAEQASLIEQALVL
jgi:2-oxoglutarate dehydrogenase E1 component